jgi:hypothetical protein
LKLTGSYSNFRAFRTSTVDGAGGEPVVLRDDRGKVQRFFIDADYGHSFSSKLFGSLDLDFQRFAYTESTNVDNSALSGKVEATFAYNSRITIGLNALARYRVFDGRAFRPGSTTTIFNPNVILQLKISPTLSFNLNGGPSGVFVEGDNSQGILVRQYSGGELAGVPFGRNLNACSSVDGLPILSSCAFEQAASLTGRIPSFSFVNYLPGQSPVQASEDSLTYFLTAELRKKLARGQLRIAYVRTENGAIGNGASTIDDVLTAQINWSPAELWQLSVSGVWSKRKSAIDSFSVPLVVAGDSGLLTDNSNPVAEAVGLLAGPVIRNNSELNQFFFNSSVARRLSDKTRLQLRFQYSRQNEELIISDIFRSLDNFKVALSFHYEFDPYRF